jgi:AraC family transcriptional regulator
MELDPSALFKVSAPPSRCVSSVGSRWSGVFFADVTAAPGGEFHQDHEVVVVQRWRTPLCIREGSDAGWTTHPPAVWVRVPGDAQHGAWRGSTELQLLFVSPAQVEAVLGAPWGRTGLTRWRAPTSDLPFVGEVLTAMASDIEDGYPAGPLTGDALVLALLTHLEGRAAAPASPGPRVLGRRLAAVRDHIEANLARPLRIAELAEVACVRPRRLADLFAAETGCSPHRYILQRRVERAKSLMGDPGLTVEQIARAVGFSDGSQLAKVFRRHMGEAPGPYRRAILGPLAPRGAR